MHFFRFRLLLNSSARQLKQQLRSAQVAGQWRGSTALTLPLFWRRSTVSPVFFGRYLRSSHHSFVPPPSLISHLASVDVTQNGPKIVLCRMMPRCCATRAAQRRMGAVTRTQECRPIFTDVQASGIRQTNRLLKESASSSSFLTFWNRNKMFRFIKHGQSQEGKSAADGTLGTARAAPVLQITTRGLSVCQQEPCRAREATEEITK